MKEEKFITNSAEETKEVGGQIADNLKGGECLVFFGNLGSGKTTFIQGLAKGLGIDKRIISPTFIIIRHYRINNGNFYHIDLYRTGSTDDLLGLGIDEILEDKENIVAIEWAEKLKGILPDKRIEIYCEYLDEQKREITIKHYE